MRSPSAGAVSWNAACWLLRKEFSELILSRSWWLLLLAIGPLVGVSFLSAARSYAEASGSGGAAGGLADALWPLDGILVPTFGAYEIAALFLLPFVAIRVVAGDRQSGALKLEMQHSMPSSARIGVKALVLFAGWLVAGIPALIALVEWRAIGGSLYAPELAGVALGHLLNAGIVIALAAAAASISEHPSTAAILTLAFTVGTWVLNFVAAVQGGIWARLALYTPAEMLQTFQHGLIRVNLVLTALILMGAGLGIAATWTRLGIPARRRAAESVALAGLAAALIFGCSFLRTDCDVSENRRNSLPEADRELLRRIHGPISIEAHLAAEDPRHFDLERHTLSKLRRSLPQLTVQYVAATSLGLFEQANPHYGEIWYNLDGHRAMNRGTSTEAALETIYSLAGLQPPKEEEPSLHGHPLVAQPAGAALLFYGIWPALVLGAYFLTRRRFA